MLPEICLQLKHDWIQIRENRGIHLRQWYAVSFHPKRLEPKNTYF